MNECACHRWVYTLVQSHIRHLHGLPAETDELAAEAIEEFDEDAPLLSPGPGAGARSTESLV
jgi:anthranilate/para-aminobenzoate synthase component II